MILPLFATRDLAGGPTTYTTLFAIMSAGSVVGALVIARRTSADNVFLAQCTVGFGAAMLVLAAAPTTAVACLAVIPVGVGSVMVISGSNAVLQLGTTPAMRGRVLALLAVVFLGSTPVGGPISGWVSQTFGARWALTLGAVAALLSGALALRAARALDVAHPIRIEPPLRVDPSPAVVVPGR